MISPVAELRRFVHAALVEPVPRDHLESDAAFRRRRVVALATLLLGAGVLAWALRIEPGDPLFYVATLLLAGVWAAGAFASGRLHLGRAHTRAGSEPSRAVVQSLALGTLLLLLFLAGALVVARIPALREPVDGLLAHAAVGSLPIVAAITAVNGIAEELYFRGALYAGMYLNGCDLRKLPLVERKALLLGLITGLQRRVTGGVLGPIITHLTWSLGMLFLLPHALEIAR